MSEVARKDVGRVDDETACRSPVDSGDAKGVTKTRRSPERDRPGDTESPRRQSRRQASRKRRRIAKTIYADRYGIAAVVKLGGIQRERRFPPGTPIKTMRAWQDTTRASLRALPKAQRHTLAHDAPRYLEQVKKLDSFSARRRNLNLWLAKFGGYLTLSLEQHISALNAQLQEWREVRSGATCNHRRSALMNLVKILYGRRAAAGLSDLVTFPKAPPKPRSVNRAHITAVLSQIEPRTIWGARLRLLQWTGMRPSQMGRLTPDHFVLEPDNDMEPHVVVPQGKEGRTALVPLLEEGIAAARDFMELEAYGACDTEKANRVLAAAARKAGLKPFTTYQIRHSFAAGLRASGADLADIQYMYGHTNSKTTSFYAPVDMKKNQEAIRRLRATEKAKEGDGSMR